MKSTLAIAAGCVIAALAVGDTVYRISPRPGRTYPDIASTRGGLGDITQLTGDEDDAMTGTLDDLFAQEMREGIDADELASIRQLAAIAKPHDSSWGEDFFKDVDGKVGGASPYAMASTTGAWDTTLGASMAHSATSGPMSYFANSGSGGGLVDQFSLSAPGGGPSNAYGGGAGGGSGESGNRPAVIVSSLSSTAVFAVPEPTSVSLLGLGALGLLARRRRAR